MMIASMFPEILSELQGESSRLGLVGFRRIVAQTLTEGVQAEIVRGRAELKGELGGRKRPDSFGNANPTS